MEIVRKNFKICEHNQIYYKCPLCSLKKVKYTKIEEILENEENKILEIQAKRSSKIKN